MAKLLIVKTIQTVDANKRKLSIYYGMINCSSNDEIHIKRAIESTRNPNVLTAILTQNMSQKHISEITLTLGRMKESICKADTIQAGFFPLEGCNNHCKTCILHDIEEKLEKTIIGDYFLPPHCMN